MPCLMKTWSRLSSVTCGRNECRLKRATGGGPASPRISQHQFNKQNPGGAIGGGSIVPTPDSCKAANSIILDHSASLSLVAKRDGVRPHRVCLPRERQKGENQGRSVFIEKSWLIESPRSHFRNMRSSRV